MKILSSQLSMDASTGHMDVTKQGLSGSSKQQQFELNLPTRQMGTSAFFGHSQVSSMQANSVVSSSEEESVYVDSKERMLEHVIGNITGTKVRVAENPSVEKGEGSWLDNRPSRAARRYYRVGGEPFQISLAASVTRVEHEYLNMSSTGSVTTADGRNIDFNLNFSMESKSISRQSVAFEGLLGNFIDPLVFNFDGGLDMLSEEKDFTFDLDCDGEGDEICSLNKGSGFLALDLNDDKEINDGSELFGPSTGTGFGELAEYDKDNNNWIDENDPIFDQLLVWMGAGGEDSSLVSLKEAGVGAISLQNVESPFNLKNSHGDVVGKVDSSGIFLTEKGEVKSFKEIDLLATDDDAVNSSTPNDMGLGGESELLKNLRGRFLEHREKMLAALERKQHAERQEEEQESWLQKKFWEWQEDKQAMS